MSRKATYISKKEIISIEYFLENYINLKNEKLIKYDGEKDLTHNNLREYLIEKCSFIPKRIPFANIRKDEYASGRYLFVKDEHAKVIAYYNPVLSVGEIINTLNSNKEKLREIREKLLAEQGYEYAGLFNDEIVKKEIISFEEYKQRENLTFDEKQEEFLYYDDVTLPIGKQPKKMFINYRK